MNKLMNLRRYGSRSIKVFIKRHGHFAERDILMLLRECFPLPLTSSRKRKC